jgi:hypothetical protein
MVKLDQLETLLFYMATLLRLEYSRKKSNENEKSKLFAC